MTDVSLPPLPLPRIFTPVQSNEYIQSVARCLQMMLRVDEYRFAFVVVDGISTLIAILGSRVNFQVSGGFYLLLRHEPFVHYELKFHHIQLTNNTIMIVGWNKWRSICPIL